MYQELVPSPSKNGDHDDSNGPDVEKRGEENENEEDDDGGTRQQNIVLSTPSTNNNIHASSNSRAASSSKIINHQTTGGALWGTYNEDEAKNSFQEALNAWRSQADTSTRASSSHKTSSGNSTGMMDTARAGTEIEIQTTNGNESAVPSNRIQLSQEFCHGLRDRIRTTYFEQLLAMKAKKKEEELVRLMKESELASTTDDGTAQALLPAIKPQEEGSV